MFWVGNGLAAEDTNNFIVNGDKDTNDFYIHEEDKINVLFTEDKKITDDLNTNTIPIHGKTNRFSILVT